MALISNESKDHPRQYAGHIIIPEKPGKSILFCTFRRIEHVHIHLRVGHGHAVGVKRRADGLHEVIIHGPVVRRFAPDAHGVLDIALPVARHAHERRRLRQNARHERHGVVQRRLHLLRAAGIVRAERQVHAPLQLAVIIDDLGRREVAVRHVNVLIIQRAQLRVDQADVLDGAAHVAGLDEITVLERPREQDGDAAHGVGQAVLHRERQSQAEQAEHGQQRRDVKAETVGHDEDGHELQRDLEHLEDESAQALRQARVRRDAPRDAHDEPDDEHADHERDGGGDELFKRETAEAEADGVVHVLDAVFRGFERVLIGVRIQMAVSPFVVICCLVYAIPRRFSTRSGARGKA